MENKARHNITLSKIMHDMWESKGTWFSNCLSSVNAMYLLLEYHLSHLDTLSTKAEETLSRFCSDDSEGAVRKKIANKETYDDELCKLFH